MKRVKKSKLSGQQVGKHFADNSSRWIGVVGTVASIFGAVPTIMTSFGIKSARHIIVGTLGVSVLTLVTLTLAIKALTKLQSQKSLDREKGPRAFRLEFDKEIKNVIQKSLPRGASVTFSH